MGLRWMVIAGLVVALAGCAVVQIHREAVPRIPSGEPAAIQATTSATRRRARRRA